MALKGIRVVELAGLAPGPYCGMLLADFGASVTKVDKVGTVEPPVNRMNRGKRAIAVDLKHPKGIDIIRRITQKSDVFIDPFRPGVTEKLGLGPKDLVVDNPSLIYARITGYGQSGPWMKRAGHDINYVALSGLLSMLGRADHKPTQPINLLADFAGGGLMCAMGIVMALFERTKSGKGQIIDMSMTEGAAYVGSFIFASQDSQFMWGKARGKNMLDTGLPIYDTYHTSDNRFVAVGALEPKFHFEFFNKLGLSPDEMVPLMFVDVDKAFHIIEKEFAKKTRDEWVQIFEGSDACVVPVLQLDEVGHHPQNKDRQSFVSYESPDMPNTTLWEPVPAPRLSRTPATPVHSSGPAVDEHSKEILHELNMDDSEIEQLTAQGIVSATTNKQVKKAKL